MADDNKKEETKNLEKTGDANIVISELLTQIKELKKDIAELKENNAKEIEKIKSEANEEKIQAVRSILKGERGDNDVEAEKKKEENVKTLVQNEQDECEKALKEIL